MKLHVFKGVQRLIVLSVFMLCLLGVGFYVNHAVHQHESTKPGKTTKSSSPHVSVSDPETSVPKVTAQSDEATSSTPDTTSSKTTTSVTKSSATAGRAGPTTVDGSSTASYPPTSDFKPVLSFSTVTLSSENSWIVSDFLTSVKDGSWSGGGPQFADLTINGYDTNTISIQWSYNGSGKDTIALAIKCIHTPTTAGSTTANLVSKDIYGRTSTSSLNISWTNL